VSADFLNFHKFPHRNLWKFRPRGTLLDFETLVKEAGFNPDEFQ